jgi:hypothetical protein
MFVKLFSQMTSSIDLLPNRIINLNTSEEQVHRLNSMIHVADVFYSQE